MTSDRSRAGRKPAAKKSPAPVKPLALEVIVEHPGWRADWPRRGPRLRALAQAALGHEGRAGGAITLLLTSDAALRALNQRFRAKDKPTNVLSFPGEGAMIGDIAMAYETCAREAAAQSKPFAHHAAHLFLHGLLHCLGHDHETDAQADRMEGLETALLARLGIPDPYRA